MSMPTSPKEEAMTDQRLLYGVWGDSLVVLGETWAHQADDELRRLRAVTTWAQAVEVIGTMEAVRAPFDPDEYLEENEIDPDEALSWEDLPGVGDGDFPPMPGSYTEDFLPEDLLEGADGLDVGEVETTASGSYVYIGLDQEDTLVRALRDRGYDTVRDDDLITRIGWID